MTTVYLNGAIHTLDELERSCSAMAVRDGKIADLGSDYEIKRRYPDAELIDLQGATVIPGMIDTHGHLFMAADSEADEPMFIPDSLEALFEDIRRQVESRPEGSWIAYPNTYPLRMKELRYPTLAELDAIAPDHPVAVDGFYSAQLNSCALRQLDLEHLPQGGKVMRDAQGNLTGTLLNCNGMLNPYYPKRKGPLKDAIRGAMEAYSRMGITMSFEGISNYPAIQAVRQLQEEGRQDVRLRYTMVIPPQLDEEEFLNQIAAADCGDPAYARIGYIKKIIDGGILTGTSLMEHGYRKEALEEMFSLGGVSDGWLGNCVNDVDVLVESIRLAQKAGLQFGAHCVGSLAAEKLIQAYEKVDEERPVKGQRHALIHADFLDKEMLARIRRLGLYVLFQPAWHYMDAPFMDQVLYPEDADRLLPYMDILMSGIHAAAGSDHMVKLDADQSVNPFNPFIGLYNMVTCRARDGQVYGRGQQIDRMSALAYYTRYAAQACFDETLTGSLEIGKAADFVVLDRDYFTCPECQIKEIKPVMTVVNGRCVYGGI